MCIWYKKKFHTYLFGHPFELITNHRPLLTLLSESKAPSPQASARIRRSLFMASYEYTMKFRGTQLHSNADALSRLPPPVPPPVQQEHQSWYYSWNIWMTHQSQLYRSQLGASETPACEHCCLLYSRDGQRTPMLSWHNSTLKEMSCLC